MATTKKTPTPISDAKSKQAAEPVDQPEPSEPTTPPADESPAPLSAATMVQLPDGTVKAKSKLSWRERLSLMSEDDAKEARRKAAEASKKSKAAKKGTTPEVAKALRLNAALAKNQEKTALLTEERAKIEAELQAIAEAAKESAIVEAPAAAEVEHVTA